MQNALDPCLDKDKDIYTKDWTISILFNPRKFLTKTDKPKNTLGKFLTDEEKLAFLKTSVSWISSKDMDTCFILNYGYEAPLPWPQVNISYGII